MNLPFMAGRFVFFIAPYSDKNEVLYMITNKNYADELKEKLNTAVQQAVAAYFEDFYASNHFKRTRKLPLDTVIKLLISMQGGSLQKELHDANINVTASAFVQQRKKLDHACMEDVLENFNALCSDTKTYKGYRVFAIDGTCVNMARNPDAESYVKATVKDRKGYNQLHVNPLYDVLNKTYYGCIIQPQPKEDEVGALTFMASWYRFDEKVLIVADRGYESYNAIAHMLANKNVHFLMRLRHGISSMKPVRELPMQELDEDISFTVSTRQTNEDKQNGHILLRLPNKGKAIKKSSRWDFPSPYEMSFRVVRIKLSTGEYETLGTNLPRDFTPEDIKELYHARWGIETAFRELKYNVGLVNLHGKSDTFVKQEIYAAMIMSNFCSRIVNQIVTPQKDNAKHEYQVNMKMAIQLCREFYRSNNANGKKLMKDIAKYTEPIREGRADTRNIKAKSFVGFAYRIPT